MSPQPLNILCADDDERILEFYTTVFVDPQWHVVTASSGAEAASLAQTENFHLIILDIIMPGVNGLDTCKAIRESAQGNPAVILISAMGAGDAIDTGFKIGADDYLVKPVRPAELLAKAKHYIDRRHISISPTSTIEVGTVYANRYQVESVLGHGGYSVVFLARDRGVDKSRLVALKLYDLPLAQRVRTEVTAFLREAYQLGKLHHPGITELYDCGREGGFFYLAMEYVDGYALEHMVRTRGRIGESELALIAHEMLNVFAYLRSHNVIHRDIKPANIMLSQRGDIKLTDFGLARQCMEDTLAIGDVFHGTPQFVAPEVIRGDVDIDCRSDLYSLGVTLYYAATNRAAFEGRDNHEVLTSRFTREPPIVRDTVPDFDPDFSALIHQMMAVSPDDRCAIEDAQAVLQSLLLLVS